MRNRFLFVLGLIALLALLLLGCSMSLGQSASITPTPTKTQRPLFTATLTPTDSPVSADTPVLLTNTPVPPTATSILPTEAPLPTETPVLADTPVPEDTVAPADTPVPSDTPIPPTNTPVPSTNTPVPPANTPKPKPTNTPVPPTNTPKPKVDFRVQEIVAFEDGSLTASGFHNIYFTVVDAGGAPIGGVIIEEVNNQPPIQVISGDKGPGKAEFMMWASDYKFKVVGNSNGDAFSSETTHVLSVQFKHGVWDDLIRGGICTDPASCEAMGPIHYSYNVKFQRTW